MTLEAAGLMILVGGLAGTAGYLIGIDIGRDYERRLIERIDRLQHTPLAHFLRNTDPASFDASRLMPSMGIGVVRRPDNLSSSKRSNRRRE